MNLNVTEQGGSLTKGNPLSVTQERLWVMDQVHPRNPAQNLSCGLRLRGQLDRGALEAALEEAVNRHEILRTEFHTIDGSPVQVVLSRARITVEPVDLRHLPQQECETELLRRAQQEAQNPFHLARGPLLRATLFQLTETEFVLLAVVHRIVCDGASLGLLLRELHSHYEARVNGSRERHRASIFPPIVRGRRCRPSVARSKRFGLRLPCWNGFGGLARDTVQHFFQPC
jgi:hypothetical protein